MRQIESFFWGIVAALGALFVELIIYISFSAKMGVTEISFSELFLFPGFLIAAAATEELFKYVIISRRIEIYSLEKSYIINSLFVGLGFAATEFWLLANSATMPSPQIFVELSIIHLGTAGLIGYVVAMKNPRKISTAIQAVVLTTTFHASYNLLIQKRELIENYLIFVLLGILILTTFYNFLRISRKLAQD